jgi:hypothetical protein
MVQQRRLKCFEFPWQRSWHVEAVFMTFPGLTPSTGKPTELAREYLGAGLDAGGIGKNRSSKHVEGEMGGHKLYRRNDLGCLILYASLLYQMGYGLYRSRYNG